MIRSKAQLFSILKIVPPLAVAIFLLTQAGCKKDVEIFTFKGQFMNGTTMQPTYVNQTMTLIAKNRNDKFLHEIGNFTTNEEGKFEYKYTRQKGSSITLEFRLGSRLRNLPINQDFEKSPWYFSDKGTLDVTLSTDKLLSENDDTLYLYQFIANKVVIDTFTDIPHHYTLTYRREPGNHGFGYGRNFDEFYFDQSKRQLVRAKQAQGKIDGDPFMNELTIHY